MNVSLKSIKPSRIFEGDTVIWMVLFFLCIISILEVYSASSNMTYKSGVFWKPVAQHTLFLGVGVLTAVLIHKIPCRFFKLIPVVFIPISVIMLIMVMFTGKVNGASRWLGWEGLSFQPSEIAKGALITATALILSSLRNEKGAQKTAFKLIMIVSVTICGLIAPENFSTAAMTFFVVLLMMFVGKVPGKQLGILVGLLVTGATVGYSILRYTPEDTIQQVSELPGMHRLPTWSNRIKYSVNEPEDPKKYDIKSNPQVTHARIAIATCNVVGKGPGNSVERDFLPQAFSDFIFAIIIEELGLGGGLLVLFLYIVLLFRAARIASQCEKNFPAFLVMGLSLMLVIQALFNMGVAVGVAPVTGQPLPLISKGGTATIINCAYIGVMLSVSRTAKRKTDATDEAYSKSEKLA